MVYNEDMVILTQKHILYGLVLVSLFFTNTRLQAQALSESDFIKAFNQAVLNKDINAINTLLSGQAAPGVVLSTSNTTSTTPLTNPSQTTIGATNQTTQASSAEETISFGKTSATTNSITSKPQETFVTENDVVTFTLKSFVDPSTPIDIYFLVYDRTDMPIKKQFLKTVYNQEQGAAKIYRIVMTKALLDTVVKGNNTYMRIGYCIGGCKVGRNRLLPSRIILPRKLQPSSNSSTI